MLLYLCVFFHMELTDALVSTCFFSDGANKCSGIMCFFQMELTDALIFLCF
jgi:hypothetical protein